ncbi:bifunctional 2-polyprenyl-6-hydroxyphenol methylase/3-demethylubiquinol 3-O-methyltransferase UbiG [Hyphomonas sp. CY54-11-8]|uniref:class I SAM-dependent methyltransferase n=1 Tax=Hyphomonas sp. CY54-11-8 TaxID=1280944 RepID=UPI000458DBEC|nr:hypothetical protein [Hyphomonas sp. CY54-11-8]KCZ47783.1 hypothetical protein HY17_04720 [Hyphomonas sp. CY54-11-8]
MADSMEKIADVAFSTSDLRAVEQAKSMGPWQQRCMLGEGAFTPGIWASWDIAKVLDAGFPAGFWEGKRVLDIGANCGGLSVELVRRGATVHAAEPYEPYRQKIEWLRGTLGIPEERLSISGDALFDIRPEETSHMDVVLFLGLAYHFRYPQLVLDYVGQFDADHFVVSTQCIEGESDFLQNRSDITPQYLGDQPLLGWHATRPLFLKMLEWAGMSDPRLIEHPHVNRGGAKTTTNNAYFIADRGKPVDHLVEMTRFI